MCMEYNGEIQLEIGKKHTGNEESYIARQYYKLPLQVMTPFYQDMDGTVFLYLLNPSGGVLDYDNFKIEVKIKDGAKTWIGTPSATKIYKRRDEKAPVSCQPNCTKESNSNHCCCFSHNSPPIFRSCRVFKMPPL